MIGSKLPSIMNNGTIKRLNNILIEQSNIYFGFFRDNQEHLAIGRLMNTAL